MKEDISGHPRSFCASYAKDIIVAQYGSRHGMATEIKEEYNSWADHIYNWVMQDSLKPMTDNQLIKIDSLLRMVKPEPDTQRHIDERKFKYNVQEASDLIEALIKDLPPTEYQNYMNTQGKVMEATKERSLRDGN